MPSLDLYKRMLGSPRTIGEAHKIESDKVMTQTWYSDISHRTAYLYDMYHDNNPRLLRDMNSPNDTDKIPIEIKYLQNSSQTYEKDNITYHIEFKPQQRCNVPYYQDYVDMYDIEWPLGLYIDIQNEQGRWDRWLIVAKANAEATQFPTYEILKCDYTFQYIFENTMREVAGVLRSQNSYNSGVWLDYVIESPEDQQKFIVPLNRETEKTFYNQRMIVDAKVITEPRTWRVTKVNRITPNGLVRITLAQDKFDEHKDYIEKNSDDVVVAMWADYYANGEVLPTLPVIVRTTYYSSIEYSGTKPDIKTGGSYKKFSVTFYRNGEVIPYRDGDWTFMVDGVDISSQMKILTINDSIDVAVNQVKVKLETDNSLIGKKLVVGFESFDGIKSEVEINIVGF